ncbi:ABC transporter ATP-binding protein [Chryseobacterium lathyri]|jgi:lipopolysaccharide transport system ATP-binding protein|uniref:ABC transporter ATP-binding protein n=1 Tax=Chryseobacterium lathyri TaxID=395933 RepID=A0A511YBB5_9FLAO|nr:ABC transporter ATP-binding protein [Chryseobacterium lathyri]GEN72498.1 ABC transporter ATP-binding protein [Chryseobacterium lathyri]
MLALKAENISKQYRLGQVGTGTLSHDLNRFWHKVRGKEDPYLKIGEANDRATKGNSEYVWSLRDIDFEIEQGSAVGIIGRNGAGKSTLLKILSKVTKPTTGRIHTNGRIASLLEVGTGFHPEMTGRENVFLNGAILGMTRKEITRKFDEIVAFSGVERYIDTPVKRYSSGMYVRLAFAVAAHLESEILIVDEVLAVGDADFQKKCIGKMGDVTRGEGRTILFVSHNMAAVKQLCNSGILMKNGMLADQGSINQVLENYIIHELSPNSEFKYIEDLSKKAQIHNVKIFNNKNIETMEFSHTDDININIDYINRSVTKGVRVNIAILDKFENVIFITRKTFDDMHENSLSIQIEGNKLIPNTYILSVALDTPGVELYDYIKGGIQISIVETGHENFLTGDTDNGIIHPPVLWM